MEQKSQQQTTVTIKEEITDTCSVKENNSSQRNAKMTLKGTKESVDGVECQTKVERNSPPGTHFQNTASPKNTNNQSSSLIGSAILKTALTNFTAGNGISTDTLSPPNLPSSANNMNTEFEQSALPVKSSMKVKRLLSTLLQFANTLNVDAAESVKTLIFNLACNVISIEEFHSNLQEATNFPLRPFVLPFLRNYIPLLQKEISTQAKLAKQNIHQYVRQHETCVLEPFSPSTELSEVFNQTETVSSSNQSENFTNILSRKRHYECIENNVLRHKADSPTDLQIQTSPPIKKAASSNLFSPVNGSAFTPSNQQSSVYNSEYFQGPPPPFLSTAHNWLPPASLSSSKDNNFTSDERKNTSDSEWNNIYVMLNCILSMVEKTKRALSILQERNVSEGDVTVDGLNLNGFSNEQSSLNSLNRRTAEDLKRTANELMAHTIRLTEERVAFVRRKAEEAVNEVKRQAIAELQKAIAATDYKVTDFASSHLPNKAPTAEIKKPLVANPEHEFTGHNGFLSGDKLENSAFSPLQKNNCWNCGRKAQETCSGCNLARYCGSFCQHKDWESHHQICNVYANSALVNSDRSSVTRSTYADSFFKTSSFSDLLSKGVSSDLTNSISLRSQSNSSEVNKLLPFSLNMAAIPTDKSTTRTTNSRPLTPIATTTSTMIPSLNGSKVKK